MLLGSDHWKAMLRWQSQAGCPVSGPCQCKSPHGNIHCLLPQNHTNGDRNPSMSIRVKDGTILLKCHVRCSQEALMQALKDLAFLQPAAIPSKISVNSPLNRSYQDSNRKLIKVYDYEDFQVLRFHPKDFRTRRPDGNGGYLWGKGDVDPHLYKLKELLAADPDEPVLVLEGEEDVDKARSMGFVATTNPYGAGKWESRFSEALRDRIVIIIPDQDKPGIRHAEQILIYTLGIAREIRRLDLPGGAKDFREWVSNQENNNGR